MVLSILASALAVWAVYRLRMQQVARALSARFDERLAERTVSGSDLLDEGIASSVVARPAFAHYLTAVRFAGGFAPLPGVENKELKAFLLPHDPPDPHESPGRDTY